MEHAIPGCGSLPASPLSTAQGCGMGLPRKCAMLLAPAGNLEAAKQAFQAGADAVYVGLKGWSRGGARGEFDLEQLRLGIELAHDLGKKVQLAANIIPKPQERQRLLRQLAELADWGLHAVILNDVGFLREVRRKLPGLAVTASIGCGALNTSDALFYQDMGATALVLPGYVEPEEIAAVKAKASIQIEVMLHMVREFIQLGKCWMPSYLNFAAAEQGYRSQRLGGSVKRGGVGSCFRICEQPWSLWKDGVEADRRLFPSQQISQVAELGEFVDAGVDVIKIQGRSLPVEMVGAIIGTYRAAADAWKCGRNADQKTDRNADRNADQRTNENRAALPVMWTVQGR
jgi:U32 family peptidase